MLRHNKVQFCACFTHFSQGSTINTTYKWQFEEGDVETLHYNESRRVKHVYHTRGIKLVNVTATNHKGSVSTSLEIYVEGRTVTLSYYS